MARDWRDDRIEELEAIVAVQAKQIAELLKRVDKLERELSSSSRNSNQPPSSDTPAQRRDRPSTPPSGRTRGGQRGHKGHKRTLVPESQVTHVEDCWPEECAECACPLGHRDADDPQRHQVVELPSITPDVSEFRQHAVECDGCGHVTRAPLPSGVPRSMLGPRLQAMIGLLTGAYKMSRRDAVTLLHDVLGVRLSLGALSEAEERVSEAIAPAVEEAVAFAQAQPVKHTDATGWARNGNQSRTLFTIATTLVTVYFIVADGTTSTVRRLLGRVRGLLVSDRAKQFGFWAMHRRQICWAHLMRKFVGFSERRGDAGRIGHDLLKWSQVLFHRWHRVRDGTMTRAEFRRLMAPVRQDFERLLARAVSLKIPHMAGSCADVLAHREALWTFIDRNDVEPTNNMAERDLRPFVLWRKRSYGSQSDRGERYAERIMTVVQSLRKQGRHVLDFLYAANASAMVSSPPPSLLPSTP